MKLNKIMLAVVMAMGVSSFAANAVDAGHGKVTFKGSIIDAPCSIDPDSIDQTVQLGQISNVALKDGGSSSPKNFEIRLENCTLSTAKTVTTTFTGAKGVNGLGVTGTAKGASIVITDGKGAAIELGKATDAQGIQDGKNTLSFSAYLKGDGKTAAGAAIDVVPGDFTGIADFTLAYL